MPSRERKRFVAIIITELWDALNGDRTAINTIYHAAYHMRDEVGVSEPRKPLGSKGVRNVEIPLPPRYAVGDLVVEVPPAAQPVDPAAPITAPPPHAREAEVLRDALRYLTR